MLSFYCEDLPDAGLILVPHFAPGYQPLLADIQKRVDKPAYDTLAWSPEVREHILGKIVPDDWETSAILLNNSGRSIASMILLWRLTDRTGRMDRHAEQRGSNSFFEPSSLSERLRRMLAYSTTIMPNSKRYICLNGMAGDNSDVRLPQSDEIYTGGYFQWGGPPENQHLLRSVRLSIDGVFFTDGEFVGPNTEGMWEQTVDAAELKKLVAEATSEGVRRGDGADVIFAAVQEITGPEWPHPTVPRFDGAGELEYLRHMRRHHFAWSLGEQRRQDGDEQTIAKLLAWAEAGQPRLHRR